MKILVKGSRPILTAGKNGDDFIHVFFTAPSIRLFQLPGPEGKVFCTVLAIPADSEGDVSGSPAT